MSKIRWFLGCCLSGFLILASLPTHSATFERVSSGLFLRGPIEDGDHERLLRALALHGNLSLLLSSPGGLVVEALQIAETVKARGISTHIPAGQTCASACVLIFAGGIVRSASDGARIGVHMGSGLLNSKAVAKMREIYREHGPAGTAILASYAEQSAAISMLKQVNFYLTSGVSLRLLEVSAQTDHLDIRWLSHAEARDYNLINVR